MLLLGEVEVTVGEVVVTVGRVVVAVSEVAITVYDEVVAVVVMATFRCAGASHSVGNISDWLESLGLSQYKAALVSNGFDDTDFLVSLSTNVSV